MSSLLEMIWVCKFGCRPMLLAIGPSCCCCVVLLFSSAMASQNALWVIKLSLLEKMVPHSHLYSLVPQVLECAFQSDWTAYFLEHFSHFHLFSPCFRQKCFLIPVRSPSALNGLWCTHPASGQMYTRFLIASLTFLCFSFHGRLCPRLCSCRFWSLWNPLLHISHTNRFRANRVFGDRAMTSALGSGFPGGFRFFLAGGEC